MASTNEDKSVMLMRLMFLIRPSNSPMFPEIYEECDGLVLFRGKVYVLLDAQLWHNIMEAHHDTPVIGHLGWWKMTKLVM